MGSIRELTRETGESRRQSRAPCAPAWLPAGWPRLPDFCNLGTWLRVLLAVNGMALAAVLWRGSGWGGAGAEFARAAASVEPTALASLLSLCAGRRWLDRLAPASAGLGVVLTALAAGACFAALLTPLSTGESQPPWHAGFWSALAAVVLLAWFDLAARAREPAVAEARLMALTARMRPHFLFNSLNAVLGVIRTDPRRAEQALEELAGLFRALMRDNRELAPLSAEIALARQYLELERLRLGERLQVRWDIEDCPPEALVPPLMLQPLLENAVYHGIEPLGAPGEVEIRLARRQDRLLIEIGNPSAAGGSHQRGNRMALDNIRERLLLFFDLEATLETEQAGDRYRVRIALPYRRGAQP